jgi:predicted nucleotide-binding protein
LGSVLQQIDERIVAGEALKEQVKSAGSPERFKAFKADCRRWSEVNAEILSSIFDNDEEANRYPGGGVGSWVAMDRTPTQELNDTYEGVEREIEKLRTIKERLPFMEGAKVALSAEQSDRVSVEPGDQRRVFVVHGHDKPALEAVARFLTSIDVEPVILHEQPNLTRTIVERFEHHASGTAYAVVLLTPDDVGGSARSPDVLSTRARQNVVLELGYFLGAWKRQRVCALHKRGLELPPDLDGVLYVELDKPGAWRLQLAQELYAAGIEVDLNRLRNR